MRKKSTQTMHLIVWFQAISARTPLILRNGQLPAPSRAGERTRESIVADFLPLSYGGRGDVMSRGARYTYQVHGLVAREV